ncbi:cytochrome d ubiquinol oxidase subunit II [uncultured Shewanella sp.]|uniref:cytochrome d ubiquinol oxidase subunit II n=1 Tax=uncultured Shewanella sp. TaxID=173975 RepID=UPI00262CF1B5|nr:cytochrome d ubiquinol oxidase subunit II [uncultured Shewanella sp.]
MDYLGLSWLLIIGFGLLMYVILDGFTLGVGGLFPFFNHDQKDIAISVLLPTWDGNQTWLVFSLAAFYGMFPIGFAFLFPKIYLPAIILALMLLFRGICFEFRLKSTKGIQNWDRLFFISSLMIALIHGYLVGQLVVGYANAHYLDGLVFKITSAITLAIGYMLLGACRLILKTEGDLLKKAQDLAMVLAIILLIMMLVLGLQTEMHKSLALFSVKMVLLILLLSLTLVNFIILFFIIRGERHYLPYLFSVFIFILTYLSMFIYIFPYIVPYELTYEQAKASNMTLSFTLIPAAFMIPLLLIYTSYAYYIFRGKTKEKLKY